MQYLSRTRDLLYYIGGGRGQNAQREVYEAFIYLQQVTSVARCAINPV